MTLDLEQRLIEFNEALDQLIERLEEDRYVLALVLVGSLSDETIWRKESIHVWIIEMDGVSRRLRSDGKDERIFRTLVENGINIHAEVIPRSRFKLMVEGASRTAFSCNFFAQRTIVYCDDPSIDGWFDEANQIATKDQEKELLATSTWTIHALRAAKKWFQVKNDLTAAREMLLWGAHSIAAIEIVRRGQVFEGEAIYFAIEEFPDLFQTIYLDLLAKPVKKRIQAAIQRMEDYLDEHWQTDLKPLLSYLRKQNRVVPLSEISDQFAFTQLYPGHLESACEWLEKKGLLEKLSAPFRLTSKSRVELEEPAYFLDEEI